MNHLVNAAFADNGHEVITPETEEERIKCKVDELKQALKVEVKAHAGDYDTRDLVHLENGDTGLLLFLESNDWKVGPSLEAIRRHCIYRKEHGVLDMKYSDIPREIHLTGLFMGKGLDKLGHPLFYIRLGTSPGPKEFHSLLKKQFLLQCEIVRDRVLATKQRLAIIYDCRNQQIDINLLRDSLDIYTQRYPPSAEYIAFVDMSFGFKIFLQVFKYFLPKYLWKKMIFIDQEKLRTMVDEDNLPVYLGGKIEPLTKEEMSDCPSLAEYAKATGMSDKNYERFKDHLDKQIVPQTNLI